MAKQWRTSWARISRMTLTLALTAGAITTITTQRAIASPYVLSAPVGLETELMVNPVGIDASRPRLSWVHWAFVTGHASAFQVRVAEDPAQLATSPRWDTGKIPERADKPPVFEYEYSGPADSGHRYYWQVREWDVAGTATDWSATAYFQMGLLTDADWAGAQWIKASADTDAAPPQFRQWFVVPNKTIARASLTTAAGGFADTYLNGAKTDGAVMGPADTQYDKQIFYTTKDVTAQVMPNQVNVVGAIVGSGWFDPQSNDTWNSQLAPWVAPEMLRAKLDIAFTDGTKQTVVTSGGISGWRWRTGELTRSSFRGGETIDHTMSTTSTPGWFLPGATSVGTYAVGVTAPIGNPKLLAMPIPAEQPFDIVPATLTSRPSSWGKDSTAIYTLDKNIAMALTVQLKGAPGTKVEIQVGEGSPYKTFNKLNSKTTGDWQLMKYVLSGAPSAETFDSSFTYLAGRFLELKVTEGSLSADPIITSRTVHTAVPSAGSFLSSDTALTGFHDAAVRTYLNNLHGLPTDCPQRERYGYGADGMVGADIGLTNFDSAAVYEKWMSDFRAIQRTSDGFVNWIAPFHKPERLDYWYSPWWSNAAVHVPLMLYRTNGDMRVLSDQYATIQRWISYLRDQTPTNMWTSGGWPSDHEGADETDSKVVNTLGMYQAYSDAATIAAIIGATADATTYRGYAQSVADRFNATYFNASRHTYSRVAAGSGDFKRATQGVLAITLDLGMVPAGERAYVLRSLIEEINAPTVTTWPAKHILTGILGTNAMFRVLADAGEADLAYTMLTQTSYPSVMRGVMSGEGTIWEKTVSDEDSHDHPAFASADLWLYRGLAGIDTDKLFTSSLITFRPGLVSGMNDAYGSRRTRLGLVMSSWKRVSATSVKYSVLGLPGVVGRISLAVPPGATVTNEFGTPLSGSPDADVPGRWIFSVPDGGFVHDFTVTG